jgi:hypothetical protein
MVKDSVTKYGCRYCRTRWIKPQPSRTNAQRKATALTTASQDNARRYGTDEKRKYIVVLNEGKRGKKEYYIYERFI